MRFFVTGTSGFIGFHLARRLLAEGHEVAGFDGMTPYYDPALKARRRALLAAAPGFSDRIALLEDQAALRAALRAARPEVVIHLAAQAGVRHSLAHPAAHVSANLLGSFQLLEALREAPPAHLLLASTSSVYGARPETEGRTGAGAEAGPAAFAETDPTDLPLSVYAATKKAMEVLAHAAAHLSAIPTTVFRFFTVYGPWGRPDMALFRFVRAILAGEPVEIYGEGRMARDFTYVDDLVEAVCRLVPLAPSEANRVRAPGIRDTLSPAAPFRIVNIGGGQPVALPDFVAAVEAACGRRAERRLLPMQRGDLRATRADPALLRALTGYVPATPLARGVAAFVDWYRQDWAPGAGAPGAAQARPTVT